MDILPAVVEVVKIGGVLVAGGWAYRQYVLRREREPRAEHDVQIDFVGQQGSDWLVEVSAHIENKGVVRFSLRDMRIKLFYLTREDEPAEGSEAIRRQLYFPHSTDGGGGPRYMEKSTYVNPKLRYRYSYVTSIPAKATFVLIHCKFHFWNTFSTAQRLVRVPIADKPPDWQA
jgi:hypothetical protein